MADEQLDEVVRRVVLNYSPETICRALARAILQRFPRVDHMDQRVLEQVVGHLIHEADNCIHWMTEDQYTALKSDLDYASHVIDKLKSESRRVCRARDEDLRAAIDRLRALLEDMGEDAVEEVCD